MKIRPVGAKFFHADRQTNLRTDRDSEANSRFSPFCERAIKSQYISWLLQTRPSERDPWSRCLPSNGYRRNIFPVVRQRKRDAQHWPLTIYPSLPPPTLLSNLSHTFLFFLFFFLFIFVLSFMSFSFSGWLFTPTYPSVGSAVWSSCPRLIDCIRYANVGGPSFEQ